MGDLGRSDLLTGFDFIYSFDMLRTVFWLAECQLILIDLLTGFRLAQSQLDRGFTRLSVVLWGCELAEDRTVPATRDLFIALLFDWISLLCLPLSGGRTNHLWFLCLLAHGFSPAHCWVGSSKAEDRWTLASLSC